MTKHEIIPQREWVKMRVNEWKKENMDVIKSHVDRLFENADWSGTFRDNPVNDSQWVKDEHHPIAPEKEQACRALLAREYFAQFGPPDAPPLPLTHIERESLKCGGLPHLVAWFARSLDWRNYNLEEHPSFDAYARGVMASEFCPNFINADEELRKRFPPRAIKGGGLGPGLNWEPPAEHAETMAGWRRRHPASE